MIKFAEARGHVCQKIDWSKSGYPDTFIEIYGDPYLVEVKKKGEKLGPLQVVAHKRLNKHKKIAYWFDNVQSFKDFVVEKEK